MRPHLRNSGKNIAKGKTSAAYWANKVFWSGKGGSKNGRTGTNTLDLVQPRFMGTVRAVEEAGTGIDGLIELHRENEEDPPRYTHFHSLNWLSATVTDTYAAYTQGRLVGHTVSFLVDSYENNKGPRGIALGMTLVYQG